MLDDPAEIDSLRTHPWYGVHILEVSGASPEGEQARGHRWVTADEMDEMVERARGRSGLMGPKHFGPPEDSGR